jgi:hypothetical protein
VIAHQHYLVLSLNEAILFSWPHYDNTTQQATAAMEKKRIVRKELEDGLIGFDDAVKLIRTIMSQVPT